MILAYLKKYGSASKQDLAGLILDKLSDVLDEKQKANKLRNLLYAMSKRDGAGNKQEMGLKVKYEAVRVEPFDFAQDRLVET